MGYNVHADALRKYARYNEIMVTVYILAWVLGLFSLYQCKRKVEIAVYRKNFEHTYIFSDFGGKAKYAETISRAIVAFGLPILSLVISGALSYDLYGSVWSFWQLYPFLLLGTSSTVWLITHYFYEDDSYSLVMPDFDSFKKSRVSFTGPAGLVVETIGLVSSILGIISFYSDFIADFITGFFPA